MRWLGFEANLPASWSAATLLQSGTYTAPQSVSSFSSSSDFTRWSLSVPQQMPNFSGQLSTTVHIVYTLCMFWYCHLIESQGLFTYAHATWILAAAIFESGDYFVQHVWRCGDNLRVASDRANTVFQTSWIMEFAIIQMNVQDALVVLMVCGLKDLHCTLTAWPRNPSYLFQLFSEQLLQFSLRSHSV